MATDVWDAGRVGPWFTAGNWASDQVPADGDTVTIGSGKAIINAGDPHILGETILLGGSPAGAPVTLEATSASFGPGSGHSTSITVAGGDPTSSPLEATLLIEGTTSFDGQIFVEAQNGTLTIDAQSGGNFILDNTDNKALILVTQESLLDFTGSTITNNAIIQVEGGAHIAAGVNFVGTGIVELDAGGTLIADGTVGTNQQIDFDDGTGRLVIGDVADFHGTIGFSNLAGNQIDLTGLVVRSVSYDSSTHVLTLYSAENHTGQVGQLKMQLINPQTLEPLPSGQQKLMADDFKITSDSHGGTLLTYTPPVPVQLEMAMPVPLVADTGSTVALTDIFQQSFGTTTPGFYSITLELTKPHQNTPTSDGYWSEPNVTPEWIVNGSPITADYTVKPGDVVELMVGNQIDNPAQIKVQVTADASGPSAEFVTYDVWTVDPRVASSVAGTPGAPSPNDILASADALAALFPGIVNNNLCNWIADNVGAGAGASLPMPDASLDPTLNVSGGFWRIVYTGTGPSPVSDWSTLVQPGDIVRMEWFKPELSTEHISGHSTTVLALAPTPLVSATGTVINPSSALTFYDNIDFVNGVSEIGIHQASYWVATNPAGITIYRLDPNHQFLIQGTPLSEVIQGSLYNDLIQPGGGADRITLGPGNDEIQDTTAHLNGITVTDFQAGDWFDFTDLNPSQVSTFYQGGALHVLANSIEVASITLPEPTPGLVFVVGSDGAGGTTITLSPPSNTRADGTSHTGSSYMGAWTPFDVHADGIDAASQTGNIAQALAGTWGQPASPPPFSNMSSDGTTSAMPAAASGAHAAALDVAATTADIVPVLPAAWSQHDAASPFGAVGNGTNHGFDLLV